MDKIENYLVFQMVVCSNIESHFFRFLMERQQMLSIFHFWQYVFLKINIVTTYTLSKKLQRIPRIFLLSEERQMLEWII